MDEMSTEIWWAYGPQYGLKKMSDKLLVFPTIEQLHYLSKIKSDEKIYFVPRFETDIAQTVFPTVTETTVDALGENVDVLCCHEEGMYWIRNFGNPKWQYPFSVKMLNLLTKNQFKDYISACGIRNAHYVEKISDISQYPVVIKPIIGFGSIGIKRAENESECREQLCAVNQTELIKGIAPYKNKYFKNVSNRFIFEEYIDGVFYRTPFVVAQKRIRYVFPVRGNKTTPRTSSDFHWTEFEYGVCEREMAAKLSDELEKLVALFDLKDGVFVAEFLVTDTEKIYLLELSPRQTSGRIAKVIELAEGIRLEDLAVDLFLHRPLKKCTCKKSIRMQIIRADRYVPDYGYRIVQTQREKSVYGDAILTVYCERTEQNNE